MQLTEEEIELITKEDQILKEVINSLKNQESHYFKRSALESKRARELTSSIVATRREEEKAMLASDEAVSHALEARNQSEIKRLDKLIKKPYFARIVLHEEKDDGEHKEIEYKIGFAANPDCRIIDWRKAPISKLFYEYQEGDEYCEEIQGRERNGRIVVRNTFEIEKSEMRALSCKQGHFKKINGSWQKVKDGRNAADSARDRMRDILSLISMEQFRTITQDAQSSILIQGVAGSGKTTVALHRLSWLLESENSDLQAHQCLILAQTNSLCSYIKNTLPQLAIENVKVLRLEEWFDNFISNILPTFATEEKRIKRPDSPCPSSIERLKKSMALLNCLETYDWESNNDKSYPDILCEVLSDAELIIKHDETKLIDKEIINAALERSKQNFKDNSLDYADQAVFMRMHQLCKNSIPLSPSVHGKYRHIVIDEVQDTDIMQLATVINAVDKTKNLTIVGDTSQNMGRESSFPGWEKLRQFWGHRDDISSFIELKISHRSTLPIMKLADYVQSRNVVNSGRDGRKPIWFKCRDESKGIQSCIKWLNTALNRYPNTLSAVLCHNEKEARFAYNMLEPTFKNAVRIGTQDSFSFEAGILISEIRQVKGLEFFNVLIWNPSEINYPRVEQLSRNLLYVAITRAEENLSIVTWQKPSSLLPDINSNLIRGFSVASSDLITA